MFFEEKGLTNQKADELLKQFGPNLLPEKPSPSRWFILISQFKNPLVYILLLAALVTLIIGDFPDAIVILLAVILNTVLGFIQEVKASDSLEALKHYLTLKATVIRERKRIIIEASRIVPGDVVILEA